MKVYARRTNVSTTTIFRGLLDENEKKYIFEFKKEPRYQFSIDLRIKKGKESVCERIVFTIFSLYFNIHRSVTFTKHIVRFIKPYRNPVYKCTRLQ